MCRVFLLHREQDFCTFCCKPSKIKFCIEEVSVGEIYNTQLDSNEGDISRHTSQTIYFSKTNENKMSDKESPVGESLGYILMPFKVECIPYGYMTSLFGIRLRYVFLFIFLRMIMRYIFLHDVDRYSPSPCHQKVQTDASAGGSSTPCGTTCEENAFALRYPDTLWSTNF